MELPDRMRTLKESSTTQMEPRKRELLAREELFATGDHLCSRTFTEGTAFASSSCSSAPEAGHPLDLSAWREHEHVRALAALLPVEPRHLPVGEHHPLAVTDVARALQGESRHEALGGGQVREHVIHAIQVAEPILHAHLRRRHFLERHRARADAGVAPGLEPEVNVARR